jgi:hypothetical protein
VLELNRQARDLYKAYEKKPLRPETALALAGEFVLDLINMMGDVLTKESPLKSNWQTFAPFEFLLQLNETLKKYKEGGEQALSATERPMLHQHKALIGGLIRSALKSHPDSFPDEEHFQIPHNVAEELLHWTA